MDSEKYQGLIGNKNAEKWTEEESIKLFESAIQLSNKKETVKVNGQSIESYLYDFIGEITGELDTYKETFTYLAKKHKGKVNQLHIKLLANLERNCFYNGKKGAIKEASAIMNLKSNHRWTDRIDNTTQGEKITGFNYVSPDKTDS